MPRAAVNLDALPLLVTTPAPRLLLVGWLGDTDSPPPPGLAPCLEPHGVRLLQRAAGVDPATFVAPLDGCILWLDQAPSLALVRTLRRASPVALVVVSGRCPPQASVLLAEAGADLHLQRPLQPEQLLLSLRAVWRQRPPRRDEEARGGPGWTLLDTSNLLVSPDGALLVLDTVESTLVRRLALEAEGTSDGRWRGRRPMAPLDPGGPEAATLYRLGRRLEREAPGRVLLRRQADGRWQLVAPLTLRPD